MIQRKGHLFDIYSVDETVHLWLIDDAGDLHLFQDTFYPEIYAKGSQYAIENFTKSLLKEGALFQNPETVFKRDFYSGKEIPVTRFSLKKPSILPALKRKLYVLHEKLDIFHADMEAPEMYMRLRKIYPLCNLKILAYPDRKIAHITPPDWSPDDLPPEVSLPPFRILKMALKFSHRLRPYSNMLLLKGTDKNYEIPLGTPTGLKLLNEILNHENPDVILTHYGDKFIFPYLFAASAQHKIPLLLDRDKNVVKRHLTYKGKSFFSYGNIIFRAQPYPLFGRWHIDVKNSFLYREGSLEGVLEISRISGLGVQRAARASTGQAMTMMQSSTALRKGYLIPWQKSALEEPRNLLELLAADKGGLVFEPEIRSGVLRPHPKGLVRDKGVFENVAQMDFSQMYPTIMVRHNISPETVCCSCCKETGSPVPESQNRICRKRKGIVAETLSPILRRRELLKRRARHTNPDIAKASDLKQNALKSLLVTSFGYLGYRNAKFGRLESHEAVTAFGREALLQAKEICEKHDFYLVHGITDCLFLQHSKKKVSSKEVEIICDEISNATNIRMALEGIFSWVVFLPSREKTEVPVANRYFGRYETGKIKVRGIMARRKDMPVFIREAQLLFLDILSRAENVAQAKSLKKEIKDTYERLWQDLQSHRVPWQKLLLRRSTSREYQDYTANSPSRSILKQLNQAGIKLQAGEKIRYLLVPTQAGRYLPEELIQGNPRYSAREYQKLLWESLREVWAPFDEKLFRVPASPRRRATYEDSRQNVLEFFSETTI